MSKSLNKIQLIGNVGSVEHRTSAGGMEIAKVSLATNDRDTTQWHRLTFFGKLADVVKQWITKGDKLYVEGRVEYSQTETDGQTRYWTDIIVQEMMMLGGTKGVTERLLEQEAPVSHAPTHPSPAPAPQDDLPF